MYDIIIIAGNLGRDPEMRYAPSGDPVVTLNVATNKTYKDDQGTQHKTTKWFRVAVWGKMAEACNQYLRKGSKVLVEGELQADPKTGSPKTFTRQDGSVGTAFDIKASTVRFLTSRGEETGGAGQISTELEDTIDEALL